MRSLLVLAVLSLGAGCIGDSTPENQPNAAKGARQGPQGPLAKGAKARPQAKAGKAGKAKAPPHGKAKAHKPATPPKTYGAEGAVTGTLKLLADAQADKTITKASLEIAFEGGTDVIELGKAPGECTESEPAPITENDTEITPLWSVRCTHADGSADIVLHQAGDALVLKRSLLKQDGTHSPWTPVKRVALAKGAVLARG